MRRGVGVMLCEGEEQAHAEREGRNKSAESKRILREEYARLDSSLPIPCLKEEWMTSFLEGVRLRLHGEASTVMSPRQIRSHFQEMRYREKTKQSVPEEGREVARSSVTAEELFILRNAFEVTKHVTPLAESEVTRQILANTSLTYDGIQKWFGRERNKLKNDTLLIRDVDLTRPPDSGPSLPEKRKPLTFPNYYAPPTHPKRSKQSV